MENEMNFEDVNLKLDEIIDKLKNGEITPKQAKELQKPLNAILRNETKKLRDLKKSGKIEEIPFFESKKKS